MAKNILRQLSLGNFERSYKLLLGKRLVRVIPGSVFKVVADEDLHPMSTHSSVSFGLSNLALGPSKLAYSRFSR